MAKDNEQEKQRIRAHNEAHFAKHPKLDFATIKASLVAAGFETVELSDYMEGAIDVEGDACNANIQLDWDSERGRYVGELAIEVHDWPGRDDEGDEDVVPQVQDTFGLDHNACETPDELADYVADWREAMKEDPGQYDIN